MKKQIKKIFILGVGVLFSLFLTSNVYAYPVVHEVSGNLNTGLITGVSVITENCSPLTVSHGTVANYPDCSITCNSGYRKSNNTCVRISDGGGGSSGGRATVTPTTIVPPVTIAPVATVTTNLFQFTSLMKLGLSGDEVLKLQNFLIEKGYLSATATGYFGEKTKVAVIAFQKANNLLADGIVGAGTRAVLNSSATPTVAQSLTTTITTTTTTVYTYDFGTTTLRVGSRGEAVKELQRFLNKALNLGLVVDGVLGQKTIAVIKQWQKNNGLLDDGLIGPKTKALMNEIAKSFK
jgi:peptidoglycan hydrolase-like protein with peptidoglycan-binding domain